MFENFCLSNINYTLCDVKNFREVNLMLEIKCAFKTKPNLK